MGVYMRGQEKRYYNLAFICLIIGFILGIVFGFTLSEGYVSNTLDVGIFNVWTMILTWVITFMIFNLWLFFGELIQVQNEQADHLIEIRKALNKKDK